MGVGVESGTNAFIRDVAEYVEWMNRELPIGGINLPPEETQVLFAARAMQLADRVQHVCRHFPEKWRRSFTKASILYRCWAHAYELQLRTRRNITYDNNCLRVVRATNVLKELNADRKWFLMEADDHQVYIVKLPTSAQGVLGTELICTEAARLFGLPVPPAAVIILTRELLDSCQESVATVNKTHPRKSISGVGLRVGAGTREIIHEESAIAALNHCSRRTAASVLIFDIWTLNLITDRQVINEFDPTSGKKQLIFVDKTRCFSGADWSRFNCCDYNEPIPFHPAARRITSWQAVEPWLRKIDSFPHKRLWDICMHMPPCWYGDDKRKLAHVLFQFMERGDKMRRIVARLAKEGFFTRYKGWPLERPQSCPADGFAKVA